MGVESSGITMCCVSDTMLYAEALSRLLETEPWVAVAWSHVGLAGLAESAGDRRPEAVLVSCGAERQVGWIRTVVRELPGTVVVAVGVAGSDDEVIRCAEAGASGYFFRDQPSGDLRHVVAAALRGEVVCPPSVTGALVRHVFQIAHDQAPDTRLDRLTAREQQVLELLSTGRSNKEIATGLDIDVCTAKNHVHHILEKLEVGRRGEAAALARSGAAPIEG